MGLSTSLLKIVASWALVKTNTGFNDTKQDGDLTLSVNPSIATYSEVFLARYSIAAAGTQAVDLRSFTDYAGNSVTATKIIGFAIKATGTVTGGVLKLKPHATTGLVWPFSDASDEIAITVGTAGAALSIIQGTAATIDGTNRQWLLTNSGSQTIVVAIAAIVGTG